MITLEEMQAMLDDILSEFPQELFTELNGGVLLLPGLKRNPASSDLLIMGEYHRSGNLGRFISIYYGSFMQVFGHAGSDELKRQLTQTLKHEFTHHLESLAGERDLEIEDARFIADYLKRGDH